MKEVKQEYITKVINFKLPQISLILLSNQTFQQFFPLTYKILGYIIYTQPLNLCGTI